MEGDEVVLVVVSTLVLIIAGALGVLWMAMSNRRAVREMEHRERLAMIQRGLIPSPETDPLGFEAATTLRAPDARRAERWRTGGITLVGLGLALIVLLTFAAGEPGVAFGVGGAFTALGGAAIVNGVQMWKTVGGARYPLPSTPPVPEPPAEPPSRFAP